MPDNSTSPSNSTNSTNPTNRSNPLLIEVLTTFLRAATRPAVTVIFAAVIAQVVIQGIEPPQWFLGLAIGCITWWFGDRTAQHIQDRKEG
jgi:hypothetical protein